jgi:hypothetical protein
MGKSSESFKNDLKIVLYLYCTKFSKLYKWIIIRFKDRVLLTIKIKISLYRPWMPLGLREVEAPTFSDIRLIDGGKVVSLTRRALFLPRKIPGTNFC